MRISNVLGGANVGTVNANGNDNSARVVRNNMDTNSSFWDDLGDFLNWGSAGREREFNANQAEIDRQFQQNSEYNAKIEAQQQSMSGIPEMHSRTDTMLPINMIGGYAQMMPNELRGY